MTTTSTRSEPFLDAFEPLRQRLAACGPDWLRQLRGASVDRFRQIGFPTVHEEAWRSTNVQPIVTMPFAPAPAGGGAVTLQALPEAARLDLGGPRLVFVDGRFAPALSRDSREGLWAGSLARALEEIPDRVEPLLRRREPALAAAFAALNGALHEDGAVVLVPPGLRLDAPIQIVFLSGATESPTACHLRTLIAVAEGAEARVVELYASLGAGASLTNSVSDSFVGSDAGLDHSRILLEHPAAYHLATVASRQSRASRYVSHNVTLGGSIVRQDIEAVLEGEGADCRLYGLYLARERQHIDNQTLLDHAAPHGDSRELYKGILCGRSRTVFHGRIVVRPGAQKTDAKQSNPNLVLSAGALAQTRPQLEIRADDVKCTHGATVGRLDEEALFYLRSRGLARDEARNVMIRAFSDEVLERIPIEPLRRSVQQEVRERLASSDTGVGDGA